MPTPIVQSSKLRLGRWSLFAAFAASAMLTGTSMLSTTSAAPQQQPAAPDATMEQLQERLTAEVQPLFEQFCYDCHGNGKRKGKFAIDRFKTASEVAANGRHWEKVLSELRDKNMPPEDERQPTQQQLATMLAWIDEALSAGNRNAVPDPGRVTLRRLNRNEYNNTIRDLVGVQIEPARRFPVDDSGYGFDNIADVLSMSPLLAEKYIVAAEEVVEAAVSTARPVEKDTVRYSGSNLLRKGESAQRGARGEPKAIVPGAPVALKHRFPAEAEYEVRLRAQVQGNDNKPAKMQVKVDWKELGVFEVGPQIKTFKKRMKLPAGDKVVEVQIWKTGKDPQKATLMVWSMEIEGPFNAPAPISEAHRRIFVATPRQGVSESEAAQRILDHFATRAYRRPATADEVARLVKLFESHRKDSPSFEHAMKLPLTAVLVSPHFLFRIESDEGADAHGIRTLSGYELATRLSYFLWSSMPDAELFEAARRGELHKPEVLSKQVKRMLADGRAAALTSNFAGQWLELRSLDEISPDTERFASFDDSMRYAMRREIELLFENIVKEDRSILELVSADYAFVNERLARHYGIRGVTGNEFQRVSTASTPRGGVITSAAILTLTSNPTRTSPVKRGAWVLEQILGTPPPPPPPDVPQLDEGKQAEATGTLRQRLTAHQDSANCSICHRRMDPIGFALENFDAVGRWRDKDGKFPIDASGNLPDGSRFDGPGGLKQLLMRRKDQVARAMTERMLTYALGRGVEYYDRLAVENIRRALAENDYRFSTLVAEIVRSDPFQKRRVK